MVTWLRDHGRNVSSKGIEKFGDEADEADDIGQESNSLKDQKDMDSKHKGSKHDSRDNPSVPKSSILTEKLLGWLKDHKKEKEAQKLMKHRKVMSGLPYKNASAPSVIETCK